MPCLRLACHQPGAPGASGREPALVPVGGSRSACGRVTATQKSSLPACSPNFEYSRPEGRNRHRAEFIRILKPLATIIEHNPAGELVSGDIDGGGGARHAPIGQRSAGGLAAFFREREPRVCLQDAQVRLTGSGRGFLRRGVLRKARACADASAASTIALARDAAVAEPPPVLASMCSQC